MWSRSRIRVAGVLVVGLIAGAIVTRRTFVVAPRDARWTDAELALVCSLSPLPALPPNPTNAVADDARAAALGHKLFFDTSLSANGSVSCATCHKPTLYFCDGQPRAVGLQPMRRNTQSVIGSQWAPFLFWDGRRDSLWSQALAPLESSVEHGSTRMSTVRYVLRRYEREYAELFGAPLDFTDEGRFPPDAMPVADNPDDPRSAAWMRMSRQDQEAVNRAFANVGKCLEAYERRLAPEPAAFDRYVAALRGGDAEGGGHLSAAAVRGLRAFVGDAGCIHCHNGPLFSDFAFHNLGVPASEGAEPDLGRARGARDVLADTFRADSTYSDADRISETNFMNPAFEDFRGAFRTPSLRNVAMTGPYGHSGVFQTLEEIIEFYRELPRVPMIGHRDLILRPLPESVSTTDLTAFLRSLTGALPEREWLAAPSE